MSILRTATLALALSTIAIPTFAADMREVIDPLILDQETTPVEFGSGWYLRGDVGLSLNNSMKNNSETSEGSNFIDYRDDVVDFGIGFGTRLNEYLRLEVNAERVLSGSYDRKTDLGGTFCPTVIINDGSLTHNYNGSGYLSFTPIDELKTSTQFAAAGCTELDSANYDASILSISAMVDLPKIGKIKPFIGGGVGVARVSWEEVVGARTCTPLAASTGINNICSPGVGDEQAEAGEIFTYGGEKHSGIDYRVSYSATAGVGVELTDNLTLDLAYRYLNVGSNSVDYSQSGTRHLGSEGFGTHQFKTGLRYEIW